MTLIILWLPLVERVRQELEVRIHELQLLENPVACDGDEGIVRGAEAALVNHRIWGRGSLDRRHELGLLPRPNGEGPVRRAALRHEQLRVGGKRDRHKLFCVRVR